MGALARYGWMEGWACGFCSIRFAYGLGHIPQKLGWLKSTSGAAMSIGAIVVDVGAVVACGLEMKLLVADGVACGRSNKNTGTVRMWEERSWNLRGSCLQSQWVK